MSGSSPLVVLTLTGLLCGCIAPLSAKGKQVRIAPLNVPRSCKRLGKVRVKRLRDGKALAQTDALHRLRNAAGEMGANTVRWDRIYPRALEGVAFVCPRRM